MPSPENRVSQVALLSRHPHGEAYEKLERLSLILPFYFASNSTVARVPRLFRPFPPPRPYRGYDRLSQILRHISSCVYRKIKQRGPISPKEVQASMIAGRLVISSNFASEHIRSALHNALQAPQGIQLAEANPVAGTPKPHHVREHRHARKLASFTRTDDPTLRAMVAHAGAEMHIGANDEAHSGVGALKPDALLRQFTANIWQLRSTLQCAAKGDFTGLVVVPSFSFSGLVALLPEGVSHARHAERNMADYLAVHATALRAASYQFFGVHENTPLVIPMEGRFVPCGACYEQERLESQPGGKGLFDPHDGGYLLYRSSYRLGPFFPNEVQYYATGSLDASPQLGYGKARSISWRLLHQPERLYASHQPVVATSYLNSDSEEE
jgi:hypothetical protein